MSWYSEICDVCGSADLEDDEIHIYGPNITVLSCNVCGAEKRVEAYEETNDNWSW